MDRPQTSQQMILAEARRLARANNMFVVDCEDKGVPVHVLYRSPQPGCRPERIGKRRNAAALRTLVQNCAVAK